MEKEDGVAAAVGSTAPFNVEGTPEEAQNGPSASSSSYQPRTIHAGSGTSARRLEILPSYPLGGKDKGRRTLLLLANVPNVDRDDMEEKSFRGALCPFTLQQHKFNDDTIDSFFIQLYREMFDEQNKRWNLDKSIIDYNLSRLRTCMDKYTEQTGKPAILSFNELPMALEFYLQFDVDLFYMKTCNYRDAQPQLLGSNKDEIEGILCQTTPVARYGMKACRGGRCFLCLPWRQQQGSYVKKQKVKTTVDFNDNYVHHFVNKYQAILNCEANCQTENVIYALTCLCSKCDFVGSTSGSFYFQMAYHREENNRIMQDFLIGFDNIENMLLKQPQDKRSIKMLANNNLFLYQHSPRCTLALQRFLDKNPEYWCLVPMKQSEAKEDDSNLAKAAAAALQRTITKISFCEIGCSVSSSSTSKEREDAVATSIGAQPMRFAAVIGDMERSDQDATWLSKNVPKPPLDYRFSQRQLEQQIEFFKKKKDSHLLNFVDMYDYAIVAVLPDKCSNELREFIEALFITHTETLFNTIGRLTHKGSWPTYDFGKRGDWCKRLVRPPSSSSSSLS